MSSEGFDRWPHLDELFEQVLALSPAARSGFLDERCAGEPELRRALESLLAAHDAKDDFLEDPLPWIGPLSIGDEAATVEAESWVGRTVAHYEVLEPLGSGGMGVVYKARDTKLDRLVTLKFLQRHLVAQQDAKARFIHEAKAASALDHSNICTVYDIDVTPDGQLFIAMAYYPGETLATRVARGPLPIKDSLDIAVEMAEALGRAHEAGIVHRDLKPANVMLTERAEVKLLDFGIAKLEGTAGLTQTGVLMGTVAYMSPEQAEGNDVDHRSDIWSLGVVLYEMLTGERPFRGDHAQAVLYSILNEEPKPTTGSGAPVPPGLDDVVRKALSKDPDARYSNMAELANDLRRRKRATRSFAVPTFTIRGITVGFTLVAVVVGVVLGGRGVLSVTSAPTDPLPRLAVLPFENLGPQEDEYFADGITDEITTRLGKVSALAVRARRSAMRYKGHGKTPQDLGRELGVDFVLEATISWERSGASSRVRVRPQLIKTSDASQVWAAVYDEDMTEVFGVQSAIAERVVSALGLALLESERIAIADRLTENSRAYRRYLRGNDYLAQRTRESVPRAIREYESAVDLDASFTRALARIGYAYALILEVGWELGGLPRDTLLARGFAAVDRALSVDPGTPDAWMARGYLLTFQYPRTFEGVAEAFERGIALDSTNAEAFHQYGSQMDQLGDYTTAIANLRAALAIDPERPITLLELADISFFSHRYAEAVRWADSALAVEPTFYHAYEHRAQMLSHLGRHAEAQASVDSASTLTEGRLGRAVWALVQARAGDSASARARIDEFTGLQAAANRLNREDRFWVRGAQVALGDTQRALDALERDPLRGVSLWFRLQSPDFDPIRSDPRFERLVEASRPLRE